MCFQQTASKGLRSLRASFRYAAKGITICVCRERNFRIHLVAAGYAVAMGIWMSLSSVQWAVLAMVIGLVLALELLNTAVEAVVDLVSPEKHPLAGIAKDAAAGAVLLGAATAVGVGIGLFWRPERLDALFVSLFTTPWAFLTAVFSLGVALLFIFHFGDPKSPRD